MDITQAVLDEVLTALGEQLGSAATQQALVVAGGSALLALRLVRRATRDVDVLAIAVDDELVLARPLPVSLVKAAGRVARDFGLAQDWLNPGPTDLLRWGLPEGFRSCVVTRR